MSLPFAFSQALIPFKNKRFLLAVSGGCDSVALVHLFAHMKRHFAVEFGVVHYHHGESNSAAQTEFRNQAQKLVEQLSASQGVPYFTKSANKSMASEAAYREARYHFFDQVLRAENYDFLVLAHHKDDQLETRLLKLIRGCGPQGLSSFQFLSENRMRPLLPWSRREISDYAKEVGAQWVEDPSNQDRDEGLRNWLRLEWLPSLEKRSPGAVTALSRSLDQLVPSLNPALELETLVDGYGLNISEWQTLGPEQRRQAMAAYMKSQGLRNYGLSHINEAIKRLDSEKKRHTFRLLGCVWKVDAGRMSLEKPS